jgi:DNA-binding SARP family transcriptional activator/predicted ATPase
MAPLALLQLQTLGGLTICLDAGTRLAFDTEKARALLLLLAVDAPHPQPRTRLAGMLWSDLPERRALHSLRQALSELRRVLGAACLPPSDAPLILAVGDALQINPILDLALDIHAFEAELALAYRHFQRTHHPGRLNIRRLQRAIALYHGPFLDHFEVSGSPLFAEWALLRRENLHQRMVEALSYLAAYYERRRENLLARQTAQRLTELIPWEEGACLQLIRLLAAEGHWSAALAQAQKYVQFLADDLGVAPSAELSDLIAEVQHQALAPPALPPLPEPVSAALPPEASPFVGRAAERTLLADLLAAPDRLITLVGAGGMGKSRLALAAAAEQVGLWRAGVVWVALNGATRLPEVLTRLAAALRIPSLPESAPADQLRAYLQDKETLITLDAFEEAQDDPEVIAWLLALLDAAPEVKLLLTSRRTLDLRQARVLALAGLPGPPSQPTAALSEAELLFAQTAAQLDPRFELAAERPAVAALCRLVEGMPLALELAAAARRTQSCAAILAALQTDLGVLSTTLLDVPPRHRSLRAIFAQSWGRLSAAARQVFQVLAVFQDGFTPAAVAAVSAAPEPEAALAELAAQQLIRRRGPERREMHSLVQQFAAEQLAHLPDAAASAAARHACYYLAWLAAQAEPLKSARQAAVLDEMAQEAGNWGAAWNWTVTHGPPADLAPAAEAVFHYFNVRAGFREGMRLLADGAAALPPSPARGRLLVFLGGLAYRGRDDAACAAALAPALDLLAESRDQTALGLGLIFWAALNARRKDHAAAQRAAAQAVAQFLQAGDAWGEGYARYLQGLFLNRRGEIAAAEVALTASLAAARRSGDPHRQIGPLNLLGDGACVTGAYPQALAYFQESLRLSQAIGDRYNEALVLLNLGTVHHVLKAYPQAQQHYLSSLARCQEIGDLAGAAMAHSNLGELACDRGQDHEALPHFERGLALARSQGDDWAEVSCLNNLTNAYLNLDDLASAAQHNAAACALAATLDAPPMVAIAWLNQAKIALRRGQTEAAAAIFARIWTAPGLEEDIRQKALAVCRAANLPLPRSTSPAPTTAEDGTPPPSQPAY